MREKEPNKKDMSVSLSGSGSRYERRLIDEMRRGRGSDLQESEKCVPSFLGRIVEIRDTEKEISGKVNEKAMERQWVISEGGKEDERRR